MRRIGWVQFATVACGAGLLACVCGCKAPETYRKEADEVAARIIEAKQKEALGKTEPFTIERPSDTLRRRLLIDQKLSNSGAASLGSGDLKPVKHAPEKDYPPRPTGGQAGAGTESGTLKLSLNDALQVAARNSRDYQSNKEDVFRAALDLDLERDQFRSIFAGRADASYTHDLSGDSTVRGVDGSASLGWSKMLKNGTEMSAAIALDVARLLTGDRSASLGVIADATITIPLLRGSGSYIAAEPLTQAEREVVYAIYTFERFKKSLAVRVASDYLSVLRQMDQVKNAEQNYKSLIASTRRAQRLAEVGRLSAIQVDQARQNELSARDRWIGAQQSYAHQLDAFRIMLGLPADARVELDRSELERLTEESKRLAVLTPPGPDMEPELSPGEAPKETGEESKSATEAGEPAEGQETAKVPAANAEVVLVEPSREGGGPLEMDPTDAVKVALEHRLDLRTAKGRVVDAQRRVVVAADALRAGLNVTGTGRAGESRGLGSTDEANAELRPEKGVYGAGAVLDLPLHRTAQRDAYRASYISLERAVRSTQALEDQIKLEIRDGLRELLRARESCVIQAQAVKLAERRVKSTELFLQAGRAEIRDVLDAQESLISAQNALTAGLVNYRVAELGLQRDMDVLEVNEKGLWREYKPDAGNSEE